MKKPKQKRPLFDAMWAEARAGGRFVLIPASDDFELVAMTQTLWPISLEWTVGFEGMGSGLNDLFLIVFVPPTDESELQNLTSLLLKGIGTPFLISTGLQIALFESVDHNGAVLAHVRWPFCPSAQMSEIEAGHLQLELQATRPATTRNEWFRQLRAAFRQIQSNKRFTFKETDDEHNS